MDKQPQKSETYSQNGNEMDSDKPALKEEKHEEEEHRPKEQKETQEVEEKETASKEKEERRRKRVEEQDREKSEEKDNERRRVYSRAKKLIRELSERDHSDLEAMEAIQFVVAERISWLGAQLFGEQELIVVSVDSIREQFDFLSALAHKIEEPESESTPEVEEVYLRIAEGIYEIEDEECEEVAAHSHDQSDEDQVIVAVRHTLEPHDPEHEYQMASPPRVHGASEAEHRDDHAAHHAADIALAVTSLAATCRHSKHAHTHGGAGAITAVGVQPAPVNTTAAPQTSSSLGTSGSSASHVHRDTLPTAAAPTGAVVGAGIVHRANQERPEVVEAPVRASTPLVREVPLEPEAARTIGGEPLVAARTESGPSLPMEAPSSHKTNAPLAALRQIDTPPSPGAVKVVQSPVVSRPAQKADIRGTHEQIAKKEAPVESWSVGELLKEAEKIPLGHGRYLKKAYEHGEIDKEGLVKTIKEWKKGLPYMPTFEKQRAGLARRREESIEYLKEEKSNQQRMVDDKSQQDNTGDQSTPENELLVNDTKSAAAPMEAPHIDSAKAPSLPTDVSEEPSAGKHFLVVASAIVVLVFSVLLWAYMT